MQRRILILFTPTERTPNREFVSSAQIAAMRDALDGGGWQTRVVAYDPRRIADDARDFGPDLVFHLAYGFVDEEGRLLETQPETTARLEALGLPCLGASAAAQTRAQDKLEAGLCLARAGIAIPHLQEQVTAEARTVVVKPRRGACHRGVRIVAVAGGQPVPLPADGEEVLIQEYVHGPEVTVAVVEEHGQTMVLPPVRIDFECRPDVPHVMVWDDFRWTYRFDEHADDIAALTDAARHAFRALELRDYARFDMRLDPARGPVVLDANALPNLEPEISLLPMAARRSGRTYPDLIRGLATSAYERIRAAS
jgi:D-alanine-D-alanine ligase